MTKLTTVLKRIVSIIGEGTTPRWLILLIDLYIVANTFFIAYITRFNFTLHFDVDTVIRYQLPGVLVLAFGVFSILKTYKGVIRHTGMTDMLNISVAMMVVCATVFLGSLLMTTYGETTSWFVPNSVLFIFFLLSVGALLFSRMLFKEVFQVLTPILEGTKKRRILLYGAGKTGMVTKSVLLQSGSERIVIVGFVDKQAHLIGKKIDGVPVFDAHVVDANFMAKKQITEVVIAIENIGAKALYSLYDQLVAYNVKVKIVPPSTEWLKGRLDKRQIKNIHIEDLLGRKPLHIQNPHVHYELQQQVVLITGAAGSIGSELVRQISQYDCQQLVLLDQAESALYDLQQELLAKGVNNFCPVVANVCNKVRMEQVFERYKPTVVFHAAAYKHVPLMETHIYEAIRVNVFATKTIADLAVAHGVRKFVMVSTDKAVNPTNVMGTTKRIAEKYVNALMQPHKTKFVTTRFGNVLGSNGSVIPLFKKQLQKGGPLTVTHQEIERFFMTIPEACQLVLEAGAMGNGGELFVFDMGEPVKIVDLAKKMIQLSGLRYPEDIDIVFTGLRPGEKMYEEVLADTENTKPTYHSKIRIAESVTENVFEINRKLEKLYESGQQNNTFDMLEALQALVPEFTIDETTHQTKQQHS